MESEFTKQIKIDFRNKKELKENFKNETNFLNDDFEIKLKSMLIKVDSTTHKRLMQMRVDSGKMMNDFINEAIIFKLNQENF
ncbi:hypothetical protein [Empedobacter brevis]|uniref:hypothetical protein n=1 Tax=Empedobacter brevis TaxID=247 RepID=UPI003341C8CE